MGDMLRTGRNVSMPLACAAALLLVVVAEGNAWPWLAEISPQPATPAPASDDGAPDDAPPPPACITALADVAPPRCGDGPRLSLRCGAGPEDSPPRASAAPRPSPLVWTLAVAVLPGACFAAELLSPYELPARAMGAWRSHAAADARECFRTLLRSAIRRTGPPPA
ncbi:hypothetical protein RAS1_25220 [Phycisphaerae bacterium RAS1]|nr:hypothetical protein RAS1_25220 [Phycisphaerae bacterium RAS1]